MAECFIKVSVRGKRKNFEAKNYSEDLKSKLFECRISNDQALTMTIANHSQPFKNQTIQNPDIFVLILKGF